MTNDTAAEGNIEPPEVLSDEGLEALRRWDEATPEQQGIWMARSMPIDVPDGSRAEAVLEDARTRSAERRATLPPGEQERISERSRRRAAAEQRWYDESDHRWTALSAEWHVVRLAASRDEALAAVTDFHAPVRSEEKWKDADCQGCPVDTDYGPTEWPCETYLLIGRSLGIDVAPADD